MMGGNRLVLHQRCQEFCQPSLEMLSSDDGDGVSYTSGIVAVFITIINTLLQVRGHRHTHRQTDTQTHTHRGTGTRG